MTNPTRRELLQTTVGLSALAASNAKATAHQGAETQTSASSPWQPVRVIDCDSMPWSGANDLGWRTKSLFNNPDTGDRLMLILLPVGADGGTSHYHDFHEWAYWLTGDFVNNEYTHPEQRIGAFQQFREGVFLDRPAFSLHGGEPDRLESQVGGSCLIMEEGGKSVGVVPGDPRYSDAWRNVRQWSVPRIIDTIGEMPWELAGDAEGLFIKRLVDDQVRGFRATLWRLAAGFQSSTAADFARPHYYRQAHQFNYVLAGDLRIQAYSWPGTKAEVVTLGPNFYFERGPLAVYGLAEGAASEGGCVWLEVTYGKGTAISNTPIEARRFT
jgi:hypothetical protein